MVLFMISFFFFQIYYFDFNFHKLAVYIGLQMKFKWQFFHYYVLLTSTTLDCNSIDAFNSPSYLGRSNANYYLVKMPLYFEKLSS